MGEEDHKGDVPFSWEKKPGVRKETPPQFPFLHNPKLPPPPPAAALRNPSQKGGMREQDDPFLIAYRECTKSVVRPSKGNRFAWFSRDNAGGGGGGAGVKKAAAKKKKKRNNGGGNLFFSCKNSCSVMEEKIVRVSQLPLARSHGEEDVCMKWTP
nr:Stimulated by retinoic acid protein [Ipomoea batatas]